MTYPIFPKEGPFAFLRQAAIARVNAQTAALDGQFTPQERQRIYDVETEMGIPHHVGCQLPEAEDGTDTTSAHFEE